MNSSRVDPLQPPSGRGHQALQGHPERPRSRCCPGSPHRVDNDEIAAHTGLSPHSARPRRKELVEAGLIVRVGTGRSAAGNPCALWQAKGQGSVVSDPGIPAATWQQAIDRRPSWMSRREHEKLISDALAANGGNIRRALEQGADDLEKLR